MNKAQLLLLEYIAALRFTEEELAREVRYPSGDYLSQSQREAMRRMRDGILAYGLVDTAMTISDADFVSLREKLLPKPGVESLPAVADVDLMMLVVLVREPASMRRWWWDSDFEMFCSRLEGCSKNESRFLLATLMARLRDDEPVPQDKPWTAIKADMELDQGQRLSSLSDALSRAISSLAAAEHDWGGYSGGT